MKKAEAAGGNGGLIKGKQIVGRQDVYEVGFYLPEPVHRLPRKLDAQYRERTNRNSAHFIRAIHEAPPVDTVCIEVDSPSHLFLAGEGMVPTHNSALRNAYRSWFMLKNIQEIEGIGIERDLAGLPVIEPPEGVDIWNANDPVSVMMLNNAKKLVSSIRRDEQEGVVIPPGWKLSLLSTGGRRQFDTGSIVTRYEQRIATTVLADMILLGQSDVGSYALAASKKDLFAGSLEAYLDQIGSVMNRYAIPRLFALNQGSFPGLKALPRLAHGQAQTIDLDTLGNLVLRLSQAGFPLFPNDALQKRLLALAQLPTEDEVRKAAEPRETALAEVRELAAELKALIAKETGGDT